MSPEWQDEEWIVLNVPVHAKLTVTVFDKDDGCLNDDYIGCFEIEDLPNYQPPSEGHRILSSYGNYKGSFHLTIESTESNVSKRV